RGGAVADHGKAIGGDQGGEAEAEAAHRAIGQLGEGAAGFEFGAAQGELVADGKAKLVEQDRIEQGAVDVAAGCEEIDDGRAGRQLRAQHLAQQRIAGTYRGEVDEGFGGLGFGAQIGIDYGNDGAEAGHGGQFLWGGDAIGAGQLNIAAHQFGGAGVDGAGNAGADRGDPGNERGADGEAHDQQQEAAQVAAHVEQANADGRPDSAHQRATVVSTSSPAVMVSMRSARAARAGSWVMSTTAVCCLRARSNISSTTSAPVFWSRLPVGSSARSSGGLATMARARPTRCCSPPERAEGR